MVVKNLDDQSAFDHGNFLTTPQALWLGLPPSVCLIVYVYLYRLYVKCVKTLLCKMILKLILNVKQLWAILYL